MTPAFARRVARCLYGGSLCTAASFVCSVCLPAQQTAGEPKACPWMLASPDSIDTSLKLELTTPSLVGLTNREVVRRRADAIRLVLQELRSLFLAPAGFEVPVSNATVFVMPVDGARSDAVPELSTSVTFTLFSDGRVQDIRLSRSSRVPALDSALTAAVRRAGEERVLSGLSSDLGGDSIFAEVATTAASMGVEPSLPLARLRLPHYRVEAASPVFPIPAPEYPFLARRRGVTDSLKLRFVIDTLGQIDGESVSVIAATYRDFVKSVFATLPRLRFKPAVSGGCAITTRSVIPYSFSLQGISLR